MEREVAMSQWVDELKRQLESARCESEDWLAEVMGARVAELLVVERATAAKRGLVAVVE